MRIKNEIRYARQQNELLKLQSELDSQRLALEKGEMVRREL